MSYSSIKVSVPHKVPKHVNSLWLFKQGVCEGPAGRRGQGHLLCCEMALPRPHLTQQHPVWAHRIFSEHTPSLALGGAHRHSSPTGHSLKSGVYDLPRPQCSWRRLCTYRVRTYPETQTWGEQGPGTFRSSPGPVSMPDTVHA